MKKIIVLLSVLLITSAVIYAYPACGTGQIDVGSLVDCTLGDVNFTNWQFVPPGGVDGARIQIQVPRVGHYGTDPAIVTLRFDVPGIEDTKFRLDYDITLTNGYLFDTVVQQIIAGTVPNDATVAGQYNELNMVTNGSSFGSTYDYDLVNPTHTINVELNGEGAKGSRGGPLQKVEMNFYQSVPEPVTSALVGLGLVGVAVVRRRR